MKLDHVGYITDSIEDTKKSFLSLGYVSGQLVDFEAHKCKICFLYKEGETNVELVEPYEDNKSLRKLLKNGVTPYHLCYEVQDIEKACADLTGGGISCYHNLYRLQLSMGS